MPTITKTQGPVVPTTNNTATNPQASTAQTPSDPAGQGYSTQDTFESGGGSGSGKASAADAKKFVDDMEWQMLFDKMNADYKKKMEEVRRVWDEE